MSAIDVERVRAQFPSLTLDFDSSPLIFFDNPGGTQVPQSVIEAVSRYYREQNANVGGAFPTSQRTDDVVRVARQAMTDLLNAPSPDTIVFGANMTTLAFHLARSLAETIRPGDEIVVTCLDHDANVTPWDGFGNCWSDGQSGGYSGRGLYAKFGSVPEGTLAENEVGRHHACFQRGRHDSQCGRPNASGA